jgi:AcrR family transcriptional regulator
MSNLKKRSYVSYARQEKSAQTKARILENAKILFQEQGFEGVTIDQIAKSAHVSTPTIYALFQSKRGILHILIDQAFPMEKFEDLAKEANHAATSRERLCVSAKMARQIYDAERVQMDRFWGVYVLTPECKAIEQERERRRYTRQDATVQRIEKDGDLLTGLSLSKARDILWALTGRDLYRLFVVAQGWSSQEYEEWLARLLEQTLLRVR